ncbi:hypothetical protein XELAEV_18046324mg [Xenopus laevis]|uniref:B box-type domain-containing protein n=1 Tax=Xenopus laevis TaxID=8355 RepID=A0A974BT06_XENLA|nr:hypothetical protein XELAEV_18046324mg [Xenopus laevis]
MAAAYLRDKLTCSICLSLYTDTVSMPCGHKGFIGRKLDVCNPSCPECGEKYKRKSELKSNLRLSTHPELDRAGIFCTFCNHSTVPAAKTCRHCEAFLCDDHVRVHSKSAEHVLSEATTSLENRKCSVHHKILEYDCCEDGACICVSCCLAGEHRGHRVELLNEASEKKKEKQNVLEKLSPERKATESGTQRLQERRREVAEKAADETERITKEELSQQLTNLIQELEIKIGKFTRKIHHIEELCNMADPLTLRESDGTTFCGAEGADNEGRERDDIKVPAVGDLDVDVDLISETFLTGLAGIVTGVKEKLMPGQEATNLLLNIKLASNHVSISGDSKTLSYLVKEQCNLHTVELFHISSQVLSSRSFPSGQHYWEVEGSESGEWWVGVAYPSTQDILWFSNKYSVIHNSILTILTQRASSRRIRMSLDYEARYLSFYELSEPIRHLHLYCLLH